MAKHDLPPIRFGVLAAALLRDGERLVKKWLPGGKVDAQGEYTCADLTGGEGDSTKVNLKTGKWGDFATGDTGLDFLSLYKKIFDLPSMAAAALQVAGEEGLEAVAGIARGGGQAAAASPRSPRPQTSAPAKEDEGWTAIAPVPAHAERPPFKHHTRRRDAIEHTAEYRVGDALYGYVVRFRTSDGGKDTLPYTWCTSARDGGSRWHWKQWEEPRPLYFPGHRLPEGRTVVLVEGEWKADVLQAVLDTAAPGVYCVASWPGGCKAWKRARWEWLAGCVVIAWPDCDAKREPLTAAERKEAPDKLAQVAIQQKKPLLAADDQPGMAAMRGIGAVLRDAHGCSVQLLAIPQPGEAPDGWDCRDAIEKDGWDGARVLGFLATACPLPSTATAPPLSSQEPARDASAGAAPRKQLPDWLAPYWDADKCRWMVSRKLVIAALTHDERLAGVLALNQMSNNIEARRAWPWAQKPRPVIGSDDLLLGKYLSDTYGLPSIARAALSEAIETVAHGNAWHPVREWLQGLAWDGKPRLDKWLLHVTGETPTSLPAPLAEYLTLVGRFWLLAMVNRVMDPGCKFDYCPVLEGPGGLGKSTLLETLAGKAWFSDTHFDVQRGKDGQEQVQGVWIYELAELAGVARAEVEMIKAFITVKVDRYRPSYGRVVESFPRQCVLAGTTNNKKYLRDRTGNRRFWPVPVRHRIKIAWLTAWREQLMAEAYACFLEGSVFAPTPDEEARLFTPVQEARLIDTAVQAELMHVLTRPPQMAGIGMLVNENADFVTMAQLTQALGVDPAKSTAALESQIRGWLEEQGWESDRRQVAGVRNYGYVRPRDWPARDQDDIDPAPATPPALVTSGGDDDDAPF